MNLKVYIETSIVSYLTARPSRDLIIAAHQQLTQEWWDTRRASFDLYVSQLVIQEASAGKRPCHRNGSPLLMEFQCLALITKRLP
jgi:hypothetical protein